MQQEGQQLVAVSASELLKKCRNREDIVNSFVKQVIKNIYNRYKRILFS